MSVVQFVSGIIAIIAQGVQLVGNFTHGSWVVLVNPIAEGVTIIAVAILTFIGYKTNKELKKLKS